MHLDALLADSAIVSFAGVVAVLVVGRVGSWPSARFARRRRTRLGPGAQRHGRGVQDRRISTIIFGAGNFTTCQEM